MGKAITVLFGAIGIVVLLPLFLSGFGELAMGIPFFGVCMASLAGLMLRSAPRS